MALRQWHYGKLVMLWAWGVTVMAVGVRILRDLKPERFLLGTLLILGIVAVPISLSVMTWNWLGAREKAPLPPRG